MYKIIAEKISLLDFNILKKLKKVYFLIWVFLIYMIDSFNANLKG